MAGRSYIDDALAIAGNDGDAVDEVEEHTYRNFIVDDDDGLYDVANIDHTSDLYYHDPYDNLSDDDVNMDFNMVAGDDDTNDVGPNYISFTDWLATRKRDAEASRVAELRSLGLPPTSTAFTESIEEIRRISQQPIEDARIEFNRVANLYYVPQRSRQRLDRLESRRAHETAPLSSTMHRVTMNMTPAQATAAKRAAAKRRQEVINDRLESPARRNSVARAIDEAVASAAGSDANFQYVRSMPDLTKREYMLTILNGSAIRIWKKNLHELHRRDPKLPIPICNQITDSVLLQLVGWIGSVKLPPPMLHLQSKSRTVEDIKQLTNRNFLDLLLIWDRPTTQDEYKSKLRDALAWKSPKLYGEATEVRRHALFLTALSVFLNELETIVQGLNTYGGWRYAPEMSTGTAPEGMLSLIKQCVMLSAPELHKALFENLTNRIPSSIFRKWKGITGYDAKDAAISEYKKLLISFGQKSQQPLLLINPVMEIINKHDSIGNSLSNRKHYSGQKINTISSYSQDPNTQQTDNYDEEEFYIQQSVNAVGWTPRSVLNRNNTTPSSGVKSGAGVSTTPRSGTSGKPEYRGGCYRQLNSGDCPGPIDSRNCCPKGSHDRDELRKTWIQKHYDSMRSPYADPDTVKLMFKAKEESSRKTQVKAVSFNTNLETKLDDDYEEDVEAPDPEAELKVEAIDEDEEEGAQTRKVNFEMVFDSRSNENELLERVLKTHFNGSVPRGPPMSIEGSVLTTDLKQLSVGNILFDTQCVPHSIMPLHIFKSIEAYVEDTLDAQVSTALLADFQSTIRLEGFVTLQIAIKYGRKIYIRPVRFSLMDTNGKGVPILGLHDCLLRFYPVFTALVERNRLQIQGEENLASAKSIQKRVVSANSSDPIIHVSLTANPDDIIVTSDESLLSESPWSIPNEPIAPEEEDTPMPSAFSGPLYYLSKPWDEVYKDYLDMFDSHVSKEIKESIPELLDYLKSEDCLKVFLPKSWTGLTKFPPLELEFLDTMPDQLRAHARHVNPRLMEAAEKEFSRLRQYFYEPSTSLVVSPLVIAPKTTAPFIRFCGDSREVNKHIKIAQRHIPHVQYSLEKASKFSIYIDLDATNSFHQIRLGPRTSNILSVKTPWGIFRPRFLPEGVGPASGILQEYVSKIFAGFEDWTIVIFDNFLVLASDYHDAYTKFRKVIERSCEHGLVLKFAKSWLGFKEVSFFGYLLSGGKYGMSTQRKDSIMSLPFPTSRQGMMRCLGAGLFFKPFVPNYSEIAASLNAMIHKDFDWTPSTWKLDYVKAFEEYKLALKESVELYFPDYTATWYVRTDASQIACGAVLFQTAVDPSDSTKNILQVVQLASMKFSDTALRWDIHKKECFALFYAFKSFGYFLVGKPFILECDHKNLISMEKSDSAIVIRWRMYMQNFQFVLRHIPGSQNVSADHLSRMYDDDPSATKLATQVISAVSNELTLGPPSGPPREQLFPEAPEFYLKQIHGGRRGHWSARVTWNRLNTEFPGHRIPYSFVENFVATCPTCQKMRLGMTDSITSVPRNLQVAHARRRVGVDRLAVTPPDKYGHCNVVSIVEFFSGFFQCYPTKDYTANSLATALFLFYCTYGTFDEIASDPGSDLMSETLALLHKWLGMKHVVSLVDRHESNGVERHNQECLRHLSALVFDERLKDRWGEPIIIALINYTINDSVNRETGSRPFDVKFGSFAGTYFRLPATLGPKERSSKFLELLNEDLHYVHEAVKTYKQRAVVRRLQGATEATQNQYQPGDFVLYLRYPNSSMRPQKLDSRWAGPYKVSSQEHNDLYVNHAATGEFTKLHVDRCKVFHGDPRTAFETAMRDQDQFEVTAIKSWRGDITKRKSLQFLTFYADGDSVWHDYNKDISTTQAFSDFCTNNNILRELLFTKLTDAKSHVAKIKKTPIDELRVFHGQGDSRHDYIIPEIGPGTVAYLDLRSYSDPSLTWYYSLDLPEPDLLTYVFEIHYEDFLDKYHHTINVTIPDIKAEFAVDSYWIYCYGMNTVFTPSTMVLLDVDFLLAHLEIMPEKERAGFLKLHG